MTLNVGTIPPDQYETYEQMILSEQIPIDEVVQLCSDDRAFHAWYMPRAEAKFNQGKSDWKP